MATNFKIMKNLSFKEWKQTGFHMKNKIKFFIPYVFSVDKTQFMSKRGYNVEKQNKYLKKIYDSFE